MDNMRQAPHSYYPAPDVWQVTTAGDARARHDAWEASDPNMVALAQAMTIEMVVTGESFTNGWSEPR